ncbi:amino acid ABC transporter permease [Streptomyces sp. KS_5]|uniref:amino acid ABC transporter permease n=1 Tax=Streptomyces sp. KS_5 TaxID=1881018 RepID=UPI00089D2011|nr:amino acid ABC transporter permease [Streptomyces sp. KS_5]SEE33993.1 amino acid ABC transporter membrane protein, PAAT family [Streptomyces sp. KS_5]
MKVPTHSSTSPPASGIPTRTRPHVSRLLRIFQVVVTIAALLIITSLVTNPNFQWDVVGQYLFDPTILAGVWVTVWITFACMGIAVVLGLILAFMGMSKSRFVTGAAEVYIAFFRGTPLLVQLIFWYNIAALYPDFTLGIPFGPQFAELDLNAIIVPIAAAIIGLALNEAAYMAEIVRGGLNSIQRGQMEAAAALGLDGWTQARRVIIPQLLPIVIPPTWNQLIAMLKNTSLISVIGATELLYTAQSIYARNYQTIPLLIVASIWYLALSIALTVAQRGIEKAVKR